MIGLIRGKVVEKQAPMVLVDVNGVGYEIAATVTTFCGLPPVGAPVTLFTHLVVREDMHALYGFSDKPERDMFRLLLKINGVGAKLALAILSGMPVPQLIHCIRETNGQGLTRLPGVGKKTAQRLVLEMKDRLLQWEGDAAPDGTAAADTQAEAVSALVSLGYKNTEAERMINQVFDTALASEELIRRALRNTLNTEAVES